MRKSEILVVDDDAGIRAGIELLLGDDTYDVTYTTGVTEAKEALGGYFREFTFARPEQHGWRPCPCGGTEARPGLVVDPFAGTGTTLRAAHALGRHAFGVDLHPTKED